MQMTDLEREHGRKVRELLPECTVLLKKNGDFPLKEAGLASMEALWEKSAGILISQAFL